jgi:YesN/AraC family two-component response regulator
MNEFKTDNILIQFLLNALSNNNNSCNFLIFNTLNNDRLEDLILELIYEHCFPTANFQEIMQSLFRSILLDMMPAVDTDISFQSLGKASGTVVGALAYINEHYLDCSLDSTAEFIGVNSSYLSSLIKKQTSKNFKDIVSEKKLEKACRLLLTTEISIDQIAEQSGYQNLTFFYKKFSDIHHCTPKKYRTQYSVHNDRI